MLGSIQHMCYLHYLGGVPKDVASSFIHNLIEENSYYRIIGRNLNTRHSDMSSIQKSVDPDAYFRRAKGPEGLEAIETFRQENRFPVFQIHNVLRSASLIFDTLPWAEWIHVMRNPIEQAHRWNARGWGTRELNDPLSFDPIFNTPYDPVPWYAVEWAEHFLSLNPMERAVEGVLRLQEEDELSYSALSKKQQSQIHRLCFESMVFNPEPTVEGISNFLEAPIKEPMMAMMAEENCPRPNDIKARRAVFNEVKAEINPELAERLFQAARNYEERWEQESSVP